MRIDIEHFLALTVGLGTAGAIGVAAYTAWPDRDIALPTEPNVELAAQAEPSVDEDASAAEVVPLVAEPAEEEEDEGVPPVIPDADPLEAYGPAVGSGGGPDAEIPDW